MTAVAKWWPLLVLLDIVGLCLIESAYGDEDWLLRLGLFCLWGFCVGWTASQVTDYMRLRIQADKRRWIP